MREIKFRAFHKTERCVFDVAEITFYNKYLREMVTYAGTDALRDHRFDDVILMQFTGLTDKHGQEIYEGDIIHNPTAGSFLIEFKNGSFGYKSPPGFAILYLFPTSDCEIIGNVHENPELLKGE